MQRTYDRYSNRSRNYCGSDDQQGRGTSLLEQMFRLPFNMMSSSMDLMLRGMRGSSSSGDNCWDAMFSRAGHSRRGRCDTSWRRCDDRRSSQDRRSYQARWRRSDDRQPCDDSRCCRNEYDRYDDDDDCCDSYSGNSYSYNNTDCCEGGGGLSDSGSKLVRYKILFVKRDLEAVLEQRDELVTDKINDKDFSAWKTAEFMQRLSSVAVPSNWVRKSYPQTYVAAANATINNIPNEDQKYLRVHFEVVARYPREEFKYEEREVAALESIRDKMK